MVETQEVVKEKKSTRLKNRCPLSGDVVHFNKCDDKTVTILTSDFLAFCPFCHKLIQLTEHPLGGYHVKRIPIHKIGSSAQ